MHFDFTVTWATIGSLGTFFTIAGLGWKLLNLLKTASDKLGVIHWEHQVMWDDWSNKNKIPTYPHLKSDSGNVGV
jgi:hypothetical protein